MFSKKKKKEGNNSSLIVSSIIMIFALLLVISSNFRDYPEEEKKQEKDNNYYSLIAEKVDDLSTNELGLYNSLLTENRDFGFYLDKNVSIDDIDDDTFIRFALEEYLFEKNVSICKGDNCKKTEISHESINQFIKERFNTTRQFSSDEGLLFTRMGIIKYVNHIDCYTLELQSEKSSELNLNVYTKFIKKEIIDDKLYFYNKAVWCDLSLDFDIAYCFKTNNINNYKNMLFRYSPDTYMNSKEISISKGYYNNVNYNVLNTDYFFNNYNVYSYKHTFIRDANGNYHWFSSELLDE